MLEAIVLSTLPPGSSRRERRLAFARRFYEGELPEAALIAYAEWDGPEELPKGGSSPEKEASRQKSRLSAEKKSPNRNRSLLFLGAKPSGF